MNYADDTVFKKNNNSIIKKGNEGKLCKLVQAQARGRASQVCVDCSAVIRDSIITVFPHWRTKLKCFVWMPGFSHIWLRPLRRLKNIPNSTTAAGENKKLATCK